MNKKIKILYLITGLNTGGAEMIVKNLINGLNEFDFDCLVVSIIPAGPIGKIMEKDGKRVLSLSAKFKYNPLIVWRLFKILKKEKPDILHTHLFHADMLGGIIGKMFHTTKIITTLHSTNTGGFFREFLMKLTKNFSSYNTAVSQAVLEKSLEKKIITTNSSVIYNGINLQNFIGRKEHSSKKDNFFISVGNLKKEKGYAFLIDAIENIDGAFFCILGEGKERKFLEEKIREKQLEEKIALKGRVENVSEYLQEADFFIMPSLWEGFSVALLEAAAAKKVIIATDVGGNPEVIEDKKTGFLVEPKNSQALTKKIKYALSLSGEERRRIGENARKAVEEKFSLEKMIKEYENLYKEILKK